MQLDAMAVSVKPCPTVGAQVVTRRIVDDQEDLTPIAFHQGFEEAKESATVEDVDKLVCEARVVQGDGPVKMSGLAFTTSSNAGLPADACPSSVQGWIQLEARLVFEEDYSVDLRRVFFISGSRTRSQYS